MQNMIDSIRQAELAADTQERETAAECAKMVAAAKEQANALLAQKTKEAHVVANARLADAAKEKSHREEEAAIAAAAFTDELRANASQNESLAIRHILSLLFS